MSEQFLHDPHIGAAIEQVGGERVPQRVRGTAAVMPAHSAASCSTLQALWRDNGPPRALRPNRRSAPAAARQVRSSADQVGVRRFETLYG